MIVSYTSTLRLRSNGTSPGSRHFCDTPKEATEQILAYASTLEKRRGFGSLKVKARIGFVTRLTSVFPDRKRNCYMLAIKAEVRKQLNLQVGDEVMIELNFV